MAGHRRGGPTLAEKQLQRRRERLLEELEVARTPGARVQVASDYLRSALKRTSAAMGERVADEVTQDLISRANELLDPKARRG